VENIGTSPVTNQSTINQIDEAIKKYLTDKRRTKSAVLANFARMGLDKAPYIYRGPKNITPRKGYTLAQEQAAQDWCIIYNYTDETLGIYNKRVKYRGNLNSFKDPRIKEKEAQQLRNDLEELLQSGEFNPFNPEANRRMLLDTISLTIPEAIELYAEQTILEEKRKKTVQTYLSKLNPFGTHYPDLKINAINESHINNYLNSKQRESKWSIKTRNHAKVILSGFFNYLKREKYISKNPVSEVLTQKGAQKSSKNKPFTDEHLTLINDYLVEHDPFTELFAKAIYYTCIRPIELRNLTLDMINFNSNEITIPGEISKNKKTETIDFDEEFRDLLDRHDVSSKSPGLYLFGANRTICGKESVGTNTPYNRFMMCLEALGLSDFEYTLYSFKHTSNIKRYRAGWSIEDLMKINRHSSPYQTEIYLRDLKAFVNTKNKRTPKM